MRRKQQKSRQKCSFHISQLIGERDEQEDSYGVFYRDDDAGVLPLGFIVADGMGGHVGGAIASQTVVDSAKLCLQDSAEVPTETLLEEIVATCTDNVAQCMRVNPEFEGMGSTIALLMFQGSRVSLLSVGDSLIYGYSATRGLERLNEDHSMKPVLDRLIAAGEMSLTPEEYDSKKNMLRSAITGSSVELVDHQWQALGIADYRYLVIASDGVDVLESERIEQIIRSESDSGLAGIADTITRTISHLKIEGQDNVTVVIIDPTEFFEATADA